MHIFVYLFVDIASQVNAGATFREKEKLDCLRIGMIFLFFLLGLGVF